MLEYMKCSNCGNDMIQSKAGWLCVECGHVEVMSQADKDAALAAAPPIQASPAPGADAADYDEPTAAVELAPESKTEQTQTESAKSDAQPEEKPEDKPDAPSVDASAPSAISNHPKAEPEENKSTSEVEPADTADTDDEAEKPIEKPAEDEKPKSATHYHAKVHVKTTEAGTHDVPKTEGEGKAEVVVPSGDVPQAVIDALAATAMTTEEDKPAVTELDGAESPEKVLQESIAEIEGAKAGSEPSDTASDPNSTPTPPVDAPHAGENSSESPNAEPSAATDAEPKANDAEVKVAEPAEPDAAEKPEVVAAEAASGAETPVESASTATVTPEASNADEQTIPIQAESTPPAPAADAAPSPAEPALASAAPSAPLGPDAATTPTEPVPAAPAAPATDPAVPDAVSAPAPVADMSAPAPAPTSDAPVAAPAPAAVPVAVPGTPAAAPQPLKPETHPKPLSPKLMTVITIIVIVIALIGGTAAYILLANTSKKAVIGEPVPQTAHTSVLGAESAPEAAPEPTPEYTPTPTASPDAAAADSQRQADLAAYAAAYKATSNNGFFATNPPAINISATDPSTGSAYSVVTTAPTSTGQVRYWAGGACSGTPHTPGKTGTRYLAVQTILANGSLYCLDVK